MKKTILILLVVSLFCISFISAVCTVTFDKTSYFIGETATATMSCSEATEKSDAYQLNWTYANGTQVELDTGTTPATVGQNFYESYTIPTFWPNGVFLNATLSGTDNSDLEGNDSGNVSSSLDSTAYTLLITNITFGVGFIGEISSLSAIIEDINGLKITGGKCTFSALSNDESKIVYTLSSSISNGRLRGAGIGTANQFDEGVQYAYEIECYCGVAGGATECINELGGAVNRSLGSTRGFFSVRSWLEVNTVVDKQVYNLKEDIFICANVTNLNYSKRIHIPINYEVRCSAGEDNNGDLDRVLIIDDGAGAYDERGISPNTTQMQCKMFTIPEINFLQGQTSECYASSEVEVLDESNNVIMSYSTTSPMFNVTSTELNLDPDWQLISSTKMNSIVNLSAPSFNNYNGTGIGNIDLQIHYGQTEKDIRNGFEIFNSISNITIRNLSGVMVEDTDYALEMTEEGYVEIELRNVNLSKVSGTGWWNVTVDFNNFEERQTEALEGIENKTGTFHLDVSCPSNGLIGSDLSCNITAYVEDSQIMEKEVDFTCYISDGISQYSSVNFNQMITRSAVSINRDFAIPSTFTNGQQYVLQCYADYYNLGSRRDSFYDSFIATSSISSSWGGSGSSAESSPAPITGGAIDEGGGEVFPDFGEIIDKFNPFSPERNWSFVFIGGVILLTFGILITFLIKSYIHTTHRLSQKVSFMTILSKFILGILALIFIISLLLGIFYGASFLIKSFTASSGEKDFFDSSFSKLIFLVGFFAFIIIILFRLLNVQGEIKFGGSREKNYFHKTSRMQEKLNREILKKEIRKATLKEDFKVRKMNAQEFKDYIKKKRG